MNMHESIRQFQKTVERMNNLDRQLKQNTAAVEMFRKNYGIRNQETIDKLFKMDTLINWSKYRSIMNFEQHVKFMDSLETIRKNPEMFSKAFTYSTFLSGITAKIDSQLMRNLNENITEIQSELESDEEQEEFDLEEVVIRRQGFYNIAFKLNLIINTTDNEMDGPGVNEEEKKTWEKITKPILSFIGQIFLAWALSDTSITDTNIYKSFETVINHIEHVFEEEENPDSFKEDEIPVLIEDNNRI